MKCDKCGANIRDDARFCPKCGEKVEADASGSSALKICIGVISGLLAVALIVAVVMLLLGKLEKSTSVDHKPSVSKTEERTGKQKDISKAESASSKSDIDEEIFDDPQPAAVVDDKADIPATDDRAKMAADNAADMPAAGSEGSVPEQDNTQNNNQNNPRDNSIEENGIASYSAPAYDDALCEPFYGVWCAAYVTRADAQQAANRLIGYGFDARVILTSEWSNLNQKPYYAVTAGTFDSKAAAAEALETAKSSGFANAYVKFSGDYEGYTYGIEAMMKRMEVFEAYRIGFYGSADSSVYLDDNTMAYAAVFAAETRKLGTEDDDRIWIVGITEKELQRSSLDLFGESVGLDCLEMYQGPGDDHAFLYNGYAAVEAYDIGDAADYQMNDMMVRSVGTDRIEAVKQVYMGHWGGDHEQSNYEITYELSRDERSVYGYVIDSIRAEKFR
ncbi:MAG: SPOR domain-containing protein [Lachnospiraceae bacterium]|nr:SPOR domain-containing protein [Lachnospiraceae bacterium]